MRKMCKLDFRLESHTSQKNDTGIILIILPFVLAGMFLVKQFENVMVYYDDYAYYSLSYAKSFSHTGNAFSLEELCTFLVHHYMDCNGRLLYFFIWLTTYMLGGLEAVQFVAAFTVLCILVVFWIFSVKYGDLPKLPSAILICLFYGLFDIHLHRFGTYWFAAFFHYVMPVLPLTLLIYFYFFTQERKYTLVQQIAFVIITFFAAFSQEQLAVTTVAVTIMLFAYEVTQKHVQKINYILMASSVTGMMIVLMSTGLHERGGKYELAFLPQIFSSVAQLVGIFFSADSWLLQAALFTAMFGINSTLVKLEHTEKMKLFDGLCAGLSLACALLYMLGYDAIGMKVGIKGVYTTILGLIIVILIMMQVSRYYLKKLAIPQLVLFYAAVLSIACLSVVPELPIRLLIPAWYLLFPVMLGGILEIPNVLPHERRVAQQFAAYGLCILIACISIPNALAIYDGYKINAEALKHNDKILTNVSADACEEATPYYITLMKIPDTLCRVQVVYDKGFEFMKPWMDRYYSLPDNVIYDFTRTGQPVGRTMDTVFFFVWIL